MNIVYTKPDCQPATVTIFAIPKPFAGHIGLIQYNAIASWTKLKPRPEIFLYGDEAGTREICQELGLIHVPKIKRNEYGTPLLDGVFTATCSRASNKIIVYLNADIILMDDFLLGVSSCDRQMENYLLIGRRWDLDLDQQLDFARDWQSDLTQLIRKEGCLADYDCKDYFVFPQHLFREIPAFAVGRGYWDTWMVNHALAENYPVVDCSLAITVAHQNHPYVHIRGGRNEAYMGREAQVNRSLGNVTQPGNIACANWQLKPAEYQQLPLVSIIIVVGDNSRAIEKCVLSVLIQGDDNCEIIVIDCRESPREVNELQAYRKLIKYYSWETEEDLDVSRYGLKQASGEFILFLNANSVLLPRVLSQLVDRFTREASTLDVLLAGYRTYEMGQVNECLPWDNFPDLARLHFDNQLKAVESLSAQSVMVFRAIRVKSLPNNFTNPQRHITELLLSLISTRGLRINWFKAIVENRYV